jgi:hypothetical protein
MKKVALVFVLAVLLPSLVLAWLAVRSLRDQQFLLERAQSRVDQHVTDALAQNISDYLAQRQQEFAAQVESLAADRDTQTLAAQFDDQLRQPLAAGRGRLLRHCDGQNPFTIAEQFVQGHSRRGGIPPAHRQRTDGMLARFLQNKLKLMFWHRLERRAGFDFRRATESGPRRGRPARPDAARSGVAK